MEILKIKTDKRRLGDKGERIAVKHLKRKGYKILEKNYVAGGYEIDIIAFKDNVLAFVEVKTRSESSIGRFEARPASSVTPEKQRKIFKTANYYKAYNPREARMRFDIIEVIISKDERGKESTVVKHLENAFNADTAYSTR